MSIYETPEVLRSVYDTDEETHLVPQVIETDFKSLKRARGVLRALNRNSFWPWEICLIGYPERIGYYREVPGSLIDTGAYDGMGSWPAFLFKEIQYGKPS